VKLKDFKVICGTRKLLIYVNISATVRDSDTQPQTIDMKSYEIYQIAPLVVTLSNRQGHFSYTSLARYKYKYLLQPNIYQLECNNQRIGNDIRELYQRTHFNCLG